MKKPFRAAEGLFLPCRAGTAGQRLRVEAERAELQFCDSQPGSQRGLMDQYARMEPDFRRGVTCGSPGICPESRQPLPLSASGTKRRQYLFFGIGLYII